MIPSRKWLIPLGGAALIGLLVILGSGRRTQPQYFTAKVERGDLRDAVEATGIVNAVVTVQVGSQVSGTILRLNADFNTRVRKGDIIAEIEPSVFRGAVLQASADLESALPLIWGRKIHTVFIGGRVKKWKGQLVGASVDQLRVRAEQSRDHLLAQAKWPRTVLGGYLPGH